MSRKRQLLNYFLGMTSLLTIWWACLANAELNYQGSDHYSVSLRPIASDTDRIGTIDNIPYLSVNEYTGKITSSLAPIGDGLLTIQPTYIAANRQGCYRLQEDGNDSTPCDRPMPDTASTAATGAFANSNLGVGWHAHFGYILANPGFSDIVFAKVGVVEPSGSFTPFSRDILNYTMDTTKEIFPLSTGGGSRVQQYGDLTDQYGITSPGWLDKHYIDSGFRRIFRDGSTGFPTDPTGGTLSPFAGVVDGETAPGQFYMVTPDGRFITYERRIGAQVFSCEQSAGYSYGVCDEAGDRFHFDPIRIEDRSGNYVEIEYLVNSDFHQGPPLIDRAVDNFGRVLNFVYSPGTQNVMRIEFLGRSGQLLSATNFQIQSSASLGVEGDLNLLMSASNQSSETVKFEYTPIRPEGALYPLIDGVVTPTGGRVDVEYQAVTLERDMFVSEGPDCLGGNFCSVTGPGWYDNVRTYEETYARVGKISHSGGEYQYRYQQISTQSAENVISHYRGIVPGSDKAGMVPITALAVRMKQVATNSSIDDFIRETYYFGPSKVLSPGRDDAPYLGEKFFRITVMNGHRDESRRAEQWTYAKHDSSNTYALPMIGGSLGMAPITKTFLKSYSHREYGDCALGSSQCRLSKDSSPWLDSIYRYPGNTIFSDDDGDGKIFPFTQPLSVKLYSRPVNEQLEGPNARLLKKQDFDYRFYAICDGNPTAFDINSVSASQFFHQLSCNRPERTEEHRPVNAQWFVHDLRGQVISATESESVAGELRTERKMKIQYGNGDAPIYRPVLEENFAGPIDGSDLNASGHWYGHEYQYWPVNSILVPRGSLRETSILGMPSSHSTYNLIYDLGRPSGVVGPDIFYHPNPSESSHYQSIQSVRRTEFRDDGQVSKSWAQVGSNNSPVATNIYDHDGRKIAAMTATDDGSHQIAPSFSRSILDVAQCQRIIAQTPPANAGGCTVSGRSDGDERFLPWTYSSFTWLNQFGQEIETHQINLATNMPAKNASNVYNAFGLVRSVRDEVDGNELVALRYGLNGESVQTDKQGQPGERMKEWTDSFLDNMGNRIVVSARQITHQGQVLPVTGRCSVTDPLGREHFTGTFEVTGLAQVPVSECAYSASARGTDPVISGTQFNYHVCPDDVSWSDGMICMEIYPEPQGHQGRRYTIRNLTGQLLREYHPEFGHDADANLLRYPTTYQFDAAARLVEVEGPEGHYAYSYSPSDQLLAKYDASFSLAAPLIENVYDTRGLLVREINRVSGVVLHTDYDPLWRANATKIDVPPLPAIPNTFSPNRESDLSGSGQIAFLWTQQPPSENLLPHEVHIELKLRNPMTQDYMQAINFVVNNAETGRTDFTLSRAEYVSQVLAQLEGATQAALLEAWPVDGGIDGAAHFQWRVRAIYKNEFDTLMPTEISKWQSFGNRFSQCDLNFSVSDGINSGPLVEWRALNCPSDRSFYFRVMASSVDLGEQPESCAFEDVVFRPGPQGRQRAQFMVFGYGIGVDKDGEPMIVMPDQVTGSQVSCGPIRSASFRLVVMDGETEQSVFTSSAQIIRSGGQQ